MEKQASPLTRLRRRIKEAAKRGERVAVYGGGGSRAKQVETVSRVMGYIGAEGDPEEVARSVYDENSTTFFKGNAYAWTKVFDDELNALIKTTYPGIFDIYGYE